ncbi:hpp family protein [Apiospora rasikravindrae]|uniref:Hpp family protein n=1 Tax=Apiospora rasikravindrae TaxID=990691 RepID=A0ABR1SPM9_9PEZI
MKKRSPLGSPSKWHFDVDAYLNPYLPSPPWKRLPRFATHFVGYRPRPQQPIGNLVMIAWAFVGIFASLSIIEVVGRHIDSFRSGGAPLIIGSFGAAAVLEFYAIESPLSQPRNSILGQVLASLVGVAVAKLFELDPTLFPAAGTPESGVPAHDLTWLAGALACASATAVMALTGTVHPPAGATALLAVVDADVRALGWFLIPVMLLGCALMFSVALLVNNIQRRFPVYWWTAGEVGGWWRNRKAEGEEHWGPHIETKSSHTSASRHPSNAGPDGNIDLELGANTSGAGAPSESTTTGDSGSTLNMETMRSREVYIANSRSIVIEADRVVMPDDVYMTPEERLFLEELCGRL